MTATGFQWLKKDSHFSYLLIAPAFCYLVIFYFLPIYSIFLRSILDPRFTLNNYIKILTIPVYYLVFVNTIKIAGIVGFVCLCLGFPISYFLLRITSKLRGLFFGIIILPFWTSILVRSYAWLILLQKEGIINKVFMRIGLIDNGMNLVYNIIGVVLGMSYILLPYMVLILYSGMKNMDFRLISVAKTLGANDFVAFWRVTLPQSFRTIMMGYIVVFILSFGYFITPALLGGRSEIMVSMLIETLMNRSTEWGLASAISVLLFIVIISAIWFVNRIYNIRRII